MKSYLYSGSAFDRHECVHDIDTTEIDERRAPMARSKDLAIDAALRSVPLPDGLITRLGMVVYAMSDETADQVDYLGC